MPQDAPVSASAASWITPVERPRLITPISLAGLVTAVGIVLALLYPQQRLTQQIEINQKIDEVSLQYMRSLLATEPDNHQLRLQMARAYSTIGQYKRALTTLQPLLIHGPAIWRETAWMIKMDILSKIAFSAPPGSRDREIKLTQFKQALAKAETQIFNVQVLRQLVQTAESAGEVDIAERIMARLTHAVNNLADLNTAARLALANGHYLMSAQYAWRARQIVDDPAQKIIYLQRTLATLQAGGLGYIGLGWVQQLPPVEWQRPDVLYSLIKLALASNQPAQAADLAILLVGLDNPTAPPTRFIPAYFDLAYIAFLGNRDLPHALQLAQTAVRLAPTNALWRERLAQTAEWSNQPQLAITQWRWLASHKGNETSWQAWMRLAGGLFDYAAQVLGLEHDWKRQGNDEKYARKIVQLYEYLGQPEDALAWLDRHHAGNQRPGLLLLSAELLTRMGRDSEAIARYRLYLNHNIPSPAIAVTIAGLLQRAGQNQEAYEVLLLSEKQARPLDKLYWENLGELAWRLKHYDQAAIAYRILSDAPDAVAFQQERLFQALKHDNPLLAAQTAEHYWLKTGRIDLFLDAVSTYIELENWAAVQRLYDLTAAPQWRDYENNLRFVILRAEMYKHQGNFAAAERDYRFLIKRYPNNTGLKSSYLWLLLDLRQFTRLEQFIAQWTKLLPDAPSLWDVYAAAYLALGRPNYALALYNRMAKNHRQDELWLLNYAVTLESNGQPDRAWQIRRHIWQQRLSKKRNPDWLNTKGNAQSIESLRLLLLNDPALGQSVIWKLLREGDPALKQNSQFVELATAWLNDHEQNDAIRAWLLRQYAHWLNTPLGARISDALIRQDREAAADILDHDGILLYDKMNLSLLAGHYNDAADLAFTAMDRSPLDESLYAQAAPILLTNARTAGIMTTMRNLTSYTGVRTDIHSTGHQIGKFKFDINLYRETRGGVDTTLLTQAPNEIGGEMTLHQAGNAYNNKLKLQLSHALNMQGAIEFSHRQQVGSRLQFDTQLAYNQVATETAAMRLIGRRNQIALESSYRLDRWNQWSVRGEFNQYHSIDGQSMGNGNLLTTTLSHELSGAHPALRTRITGTWSQNRIADTILTGKTASLIPVGQPDTASYFMPQDIREVAAYASIGDAIDSNQPAHDFEYLGELGVFYNTTTGTGLRASAGIAGRIIGADRLQIFTRYDQAPSGQGKPSYEAGIAYQLHY